MFASLDESLIAERMFASLGGLRLGRPATASRIISLLSACGAGMLASLGVSLPAAPPILASLGRFHLALWVPRSPLTASLSTPSLSPSSSRSHSTNGFLTTPGTNIPAYTCLSTPLSESASGSESMMNERLVGVV